MCHLWVAGGTLQLFSQEVHNVYWSIKEEVGRASTCKIKAQVFRMLRVLRRVWHIDKRPHCAQVPRRLAFLGEHCASLWMVQPKQGQSLTGRMVVIIEKLPNAIDKKMVFIYTVSRATMMPFLFFGAGSSSSSSSISSSSSSSSSSASLSDSCSDSSLVAILTSSFFAPMRAFVA